MKILLSILFCFTGIISGYAQQDTSIRVCVDIELTKEKKSQSVHSEIKFLSTSSYIDTSWVPGLQQRLTDSVRVVQDAEAGTYIITILFKVYKDGYFEDIHAYGYTGWGLSSSAYDQIRKTGRRGWRPAPQSGREVKPYRTSLVTSGVSDLKKTTLPVSARIDVDVTKTRKSQTVYSKVHFLSGIPDDDTSWVPKLEQQLNETVRVDKRAKKGKYLVAAQFIVGKGGTFSDIRCLSDPGNELCQQVVRVLKKQSNWFPAEQKEGMHVIVYEQLDIEIIKEKKPEKVYANVKIRYPFPGWDYSWTQTLEEKLNQSMNIDKRVKKGKHLLTVSYRAMRDSTFGEIRCLNNPAYNIYDEVLKVLSTYKKTWPATTQPVVAVKEEQ